MTTKDQCLFFKNKQQDHVVNDNLNGQFNNLNLNQNIRTYAEVAKASLNVENQNKAISNYEHFERTAVLTASSDYSHNNDLQTRQNFTSFGKSKLTSSLANPNIQNDYGKKEEKILNANSSTLSLHITAYENSIEATSGDPGGEKDGTKKNKENISSIKSWKAVKERLNSSSQTVNYAFELPRQQQDQNSDPELMGFKASQRISNVNQPLPALFGPSSAATNTVSQQPPPATVNPAPSSSNSRPAPSLPAASVITLEDDDTLPAKKAADYGKEEICHMIDKRSKNIQIEETMRDGKYIVNSILVRENDKFVLSKFIQCTICLTVMSKDGGGVSKHYTSCSAKRGQKRPARESLTPFLQGKMTTAHLNRTTTAVGKLALNSGISFYRSAGPPFKKFCAELINIGAEIGKSVTPEEINYSRKSVKNAAMRVSAAEMNQLKPILRKASEYGEITFAVDHGKRFNDYLSLVAHLAVPNGDSWQMITRTIGFLQVKPDEKDHKSIFSQVQDLCAEMGISKFTLNECGVISDEGSNVVKALKGNFKRDIRCICHVLNTVTGHIFIPYKKTNLTEAEQEQLKIANELLTASKLLSSSARSQKGEFKLDKKPRQFINTRFMSSLWVLEDIYESFDELLKYTENNSANLSQEVENAINLILANKRRLKFLIEVLKPVETYIRKFEADKYPTIHLVSIFWFEQMKRGNELKARVDAFQKAIGAAYLEALKRKEKNLTPYHYAATMLFPPTKQMRSFSDEQRDKATQCLECVCFDYEPEQPAMNEEASVAEPLPLSAMFDNQVQRVDSFDAELTQFQQSTEVFDPNDDLLKWWFTRQKTYPRLSKAAKKILSMPPSSTAPERSFSRVKLVITDQRSLLNAKTVSGLMLGGPY